MTGQAVEIPWAPGANYTRIICRLGEPRPDGADVDEHPDLMTQGGSVTLTCTAKKIRYAEEDGRSRMLTTRAWTFKVRLSDGELYNPESGNVGVKILSGSSAGVDPAGFTWTATVTPDNGESWSCTIPPTAGATFDLVSNAEVVAPNPGESTLSARVAALEASSGGESAQSAIVTVPNIGWTDSTTLTVAGLTGPHVVAPVTAEGAQAWAAGQWWASSPADGQLTITGTIQLSADPVDVRVVWWE